MQEEIAVLDDKKRVSTGRGKGRYVMCIKERCKGEGKMYY